MPIKLQRVAILAKRMIPFSLAESFQFSILKDLLLAYNFIV